MNHRSQLAVGVCLALSLTLLGCGKPDPLPTGEPVTGGATPEQHDAFAAAWVPQLPPDHIDLEVRPGVYVTTPEQANAAVVRFDSIRFNAADHPEIEDWEPGRIVVSDASAPGGKNPLGFARKVVSVSRDGDDFVVATTSPGLEEIFSGEMQVRFDRENARIVDWDDLDLEWAAEALYVNMPTLSAHYTNPLRTDNAAPEPAFVPPPGGDPFLSRIVGAVVSTVEKVVDTAQAVAEFVIEKVLPSHLTGDVTLDKELVKTFDIPVFDLDLSHTFETKKDINFEAKLEGTGVFDASFTFNPNSSLHMVIPTPLHVDAPPLSIDLDVDAYFKAELGIAIDLEASITSVGGQPANDLEEKLKEGEEIATAVMEAFGFETFGDADKKAVGGWRKPIFISSPMTQTILVGVPPVVVPVIFTQTFQVDVECGFEARASLKADARVIRSNTFRLKAGFDNQTKKPYLRDVDFGHETSHIVDVTGGGEIQISCGLIPRINAFVYDSVGVNVGMRASAVGTASYESVCPVDSTAIQLPEGTVELGMAINIGLQAGGRIQVPGSSFASTQGQYLGTDIGPLEIWTRNFDIFTLEWDVPGFGVCSTSKRDEGGLCTVNSDCQNGLYCTSGTCNVNHCYDGVRSGDETGIDCGGSLCGACGINSQCETNDDCQSGACRVPLLKPFGAPGAPAEAITQVSVCVADQCQAGYNAPLNSCFNQPVGAFIGDPAACASGFSNGYQCVANACLNLRRDNGETDVDCGGPNCEPCRAGLSCSINSDCSSGSCIDGTCAAGPAVDPSCLSVSTMISALWGAPGREPIDVADEIWDRVSEGQTNLQAVNGTFNTIGPRDPAPGLPKTLTITYETDADLETLVVRGGDYFCVRP